MLETRPDLRSGRFSFAVTVHERALPDGKRALRAHPGSLSLGGRGWDQSPEHEADHGEADEGGDLAGVTLVVAAQTSVAADPGERALHDPPLGQHDEAAEVGALDDLEGPGPGLLHQGGHLGTLVAAVADDPLDEGETSPRLLEQGFGPVAILHAGGVNVDVQQQAERVDEDVALAPEDLLARVKPLRIK
jgi:hypothetical protein